MKAITCCLILVTIASCAQREGDLFQQNILTTINGATTRRYLRHLPLDPLTGKADWVFRCYKDAANTSSWCGDDIYDVMTQSQDIALDGTKYRDW